MSRLRSNNDDDDDDDQNEMVTGDDQNEMMTDDSASDDGKMFFKNKKEYINILNSLNQDGSLEELVKKGCLKESNPILLQPKTFKGAEEFEGLTIM